MRWAFLLLALVSLAAWKSAITEEPVRCFRFKLDTAARDPGDSVRQERWCYQKIPLGEENGLYIFNADGEKALPELALISNPDGSLTHGSLVAGKLSIHRVRGDQFNPFSIPLTPPANLQPVSSVSSDFLVSARTVLTQLGKSDAPLADLTVREGTQAAQARTPWRGYWWPYKGFPMGVPLSKYDRFVSSRAGAAPDAYGWESAHHKYKGTWWEGHCNGWAASSILRAEPITLRTDSRTGISFSIEDQKAILAENDYCAKAAMFGKRYRGGSDNIYDVDPMLFHNAISYYIGRLGKPIAMDYRRDAAVDNHVVSGYGMQIVRTSPTTLNVTATLLVHKYDVKIAETTGPAPAYTRVYKYILQQDGSGRTIGGRWLSENPDFLWAPLASAPCERKGQELNEAYVQEILGL